MRLLLASGVFQESPGVFGMLANLPQKCSGGVDCAFKHNAAFFRQSAGPEQPPAAARQAEICVVKASRCRSCSPRTASRASLPTCGGFSLRRLRLGCIAVVVDGIASGVPESDCPFNELGFADESIFHPFLQVRNLGVERGVHQVALRIDGRNPDEGHAVAKFRDTNFPPPQPFYKDRAWSATNCF